MILLTRRYCEWLLGAGFLCGLAVAVWFGWRWLDKSLGNSEEVFARVRVGMSQPEVVEVLRTFEASSGRCSWGATVDGRSFQTFHYGNPALDDLPPPGEIQYCVMNALDSYGREIEVNLGPGGIVSDKCLSPGVWEYRWDKAYRELRDKPYCALLYKYRYVALGVTAGLLLTSIWMLRRWAAGQAVP
jgi:hypothetical protein